MRQPGQEPRERGWTGDIESGRSRTRRKRRPNTACGGKGRKRPCRATHRAVAWTPRINDNLKSQISNLKSLILHLESQISNLKSLILHLESQISNLKSLILHLESQISNLQSLIATVVLR